MNKISIGGIEIMKDNVRQMGTKLKIWLWVSVLLAVSGAILLFPIGIFLADITFVIVKVCMVTGLLVILIGKRSEGFYLWATASGCAVIMTVIKCIVTWSVTFLFIGSMFVDIFMPAMAFHLLRKE